MMKPADWKEIKYFTKSEWQNFPNQVSRELVYTFDEMRSLAGCQIIILECGADSGHSDYSYHYLSLAVDFYFRTDRLNMLDQFTLINLFPNFMGIGFYPFDGFFWHVDIRYGKFKTFWYRDPAGNYIYGFKNFSEVLKRFYHETTN